MNEGGWGRVPGPRRVGVLAYDGMTLLDVAGPVEVFSEASTETNTGRQRYEVALVAAGGGSVLTSSRVRVAVDDAGGGESYDTLVVPGADGPPRLDRDLVEQVRLLAGRSRRVVSICTGSFLLAEAGLLDGRAATTHWRYVDDLRWRYPAVAVDPDAIFVKAGAVYTSAGVSAGIDLALSLVEEDHGPDLARDVARALVVFLHRAGGQSQFSVRSASPAVRSSPLRAVLDAVTDDPAAPHTTASMARVAGLSTRHLGRLFAAEFGTSPARFVEASRIEVAQGLLLAGTSVTAVAAGSGFGNDETLRRTFVRHLGLTPTAYRALRQHQVPLLTG